MVTCFQLDAGAANNALAAYDDLIAPHLDDSNSGLVDASALLALATLWNGIAVPMARNRGPVGAPVGDRQSRVRPRPRGHGAWSVEATLTRFTM